ncbi:MAG: Asp-tRNA(Asn)/Glu-tRNA(Gln) amidotransferase subunit GatB [Armatimonadota bacterium]|nr:Asp-tRNA(Asn)/Glu-tRNA(Gln) amidotransferase subunit GatB [Armatimonadota bacterium]MDW8025647.1 Asp-tRNA(Asn)/Glu-tRNA(Gln) amidotransferase subunit GatB [Armatimonadota bacterium]
MEFEPVIGLEVHAELLTKSKMFCGCPTKFGAPPNTQTCPVCLGFPGVLPVVNKKAIEYVLKVAIALNCRINRHTIFERKNYYYPDLPKAYQISQKRLPLGYDGWLEIEVDGEIRHIGIADVHIEEDTGKLIHGEEGGFEFSLIDYNRSGIPLVEIVTKPEIRSLKELEEFMVALRQLLLYLEVSDCKMEQGSLRFEASVSLRPKGSSELGTRVEIKNLNSFKAVLGAVEAEIKRQQQLLMRGEKIQQQTMLWNEKLRITEPMRTKETAHDYRYFPEPDIPPIVITDEWLENVGKNLPEFPKQRMQRFVEQYGLPIQDAKLLTASKASADFFERCVSMLQQPKTVANWMLTEIQSLLHDDQIGWEDCPLKPEQLAGMLKLLNDGVISGRIAKSVLEEMYRTGKDAQTIVNEMGLVQITDEAQLRPIVDRVIAENPDAVEKFRKGDEKVLGFFVGQVMRATKGRANPQIVNKLVRELLKGR